jgi:plasmid stabilization system protein ParE
VVRKSFKIVWDVQALEQFKNVLTYLEKQSENAPKIVKSEILSRINSIKNNPNIYEIDKLKDEPNKEFRALVVLNYRVTYQVKSDLKEIRILRIRHTSQEPLGY